MEKVKLKEVARAARVHIGTASKILNRRTKEKFNEHTQQRVFKTAARLGYLHPALSKSKPVRAPRINLNARAVIKIRLWNGALFSQCRAQVVNISSTGMLLKSFTGGAKGLPLKPFYFEVTMDNHQLRIPKLKAQPVRCINERNQFGLGVRFFDSPWDKRFRNTEKSKDGETKEPVLRSFSSSVL